MTEKKEELLNILEDLRALSKKKKYRLARPEHDEAVKTLSLVCLLGLDGIKTALEALPDFPSDTGAAAVVGNWTEISSHIMEFYRALQETKYKTELGKRLRLLIGQRLSSIAPDVASRVIIDVCKDMQPAKKEFPTSKDLYIINSTLLDEGIPVLIRLPLDSELQSRAVHLVSYCLAAGFSLDSKGKSFAAPQTQLDLIRWANIQPKFLKPDKNIQALIAARILDWNDDYLKILRSELNSLHPSLRDPISRALEKSVLSQSQIGGTVTKSSLQNQKVEFLERTDKELTQTQISTTQDSSDKYDALAQLVRLMNYIKQTTIALNRRQEDVARLERDLRRTEVALKGTCREKEEARRRCSLVEAELADSLAHSKKLEQCVNNFEKQIENLNSKLIDAENRNKETVKAHKAHVDELSKRIAQEGDHRINGFLHRLGGLLRPIAMDMKESKNMKMTLDLGTAVRTQLKQLLKMLKSQGVPIDGDD